MMQLAFIFFFFFWKMKRFFTIFSLFFEIFKIFHKKNIKLPNTFVKVKNKNSKIDNIKEYSKMK